MRKTKLSENDSIFTLIGRANTGSNSDELPYTFQENSMLFLKGNEKCHYRIKNFSFSAMFSLKICDFYES